MLSSRQEKIIIGLVAPKGSGKGTVGKYIHDKYQATVFRFGDILDDILRRLYLPVIRENETKLFQALSSFLEPSILAQVLKKDIEKDLNNLYVVDAIRRWPEIELLKNFKHFYLAALTTELDIRFQRIQRRGEKENEHDMPKDQFLKEEKLSTETLIQEISEKADFHIINNGTLPELFSQIDSMMKQILKKKEKSR